MPSCTWMITWASSVSLPTMLPRFLARTVRTNLFWNSLSSALCTEITPVLLSILKPCWVLRPIRK